MTDAAGVTARLARKVKRDGIMETGRAVLSWLKRKWRTENWLLGRLVESRGDKVLLRDVSIDLSGVALPTAYKAALWSGDYERSEAEAVAAFLSPDSDVIELGAGIGYLACLANRQLSRPERHLVVEANPDLLPVIARNRDRNGCHFRLEHGALSYGSETVMFPINDRFFSSSLMRSGRRVEVPCVTLQSLVDQTGFSNVTLIADVEGAERDLVGKEIQVIRQHVRLLIVEIHDYLIGVEAAQEVVSALLAADYVVSRRNLCEWVFSRKH